MSVRSYQEILKLKDLKPGKYPLISLRKIESKYGETIIATLDVNDEEEDYYLTNNILKKISDDDIESGIYNNGLFIFRGLKKDKYYDYTIQITK